MSFLARSVSLNTEWRQGEVTDRNLNAPPLRSQSMVRLEQVVLHMREHGELPPDGEVRVKRPSLFREIPS